MHVHFLLLVIATVASAFHDTHQLHDNALRGGVWSDGPADAGHGDHHHHQKNKSAILCVRATGRAIAVADIASASFSLTLSALDIATGYAGAQSLHDGVFAALADLAKSGIAANLLIDSFLVVPDSRLPAGGVQASTTFTVVCDALAVRAVLDAVMGCTVHAGATISLNGVFFSLSASREAEAAANATRFAMQSAVLRARAREERGKRATTAAQ